MKVERNYLSSLPYPRNSVPLCIENFNSKLDIYDNLNILIIFIYVQIYFACMYVCAYGNWEKSIRFSVSEIREGCEPPYAGNQNPSL